MLVLITFGTDTCVWFVIGLKGNRIMNTMEMFCPEHLQGFFLCCTKFFQYWHFILLTV